MFFLIAFLSMHSCAVDLYKDHRMALIVGLAIALVVAIAAIAAVAVAL